MRVHDERISKKNNTNNIEKRRGFSFFGNKVLTVASFIYLITFTARDNRVR